MSWRWDPLRILGLLLLLQACGGGSPTTPPPPTEVAVRAVNGLTGASVPVTQAALPGALIRVDVAGFLPRETRMPADGIVSLWPLTVDADYVRQLVYPDVQPVLVRWEKATVSVTANVPQWALDEVNGLGVLRMQRATGDAADVRVVVDPAAVPAGLGAETRCSRSAAWVRLECTIYMRDARQFEEPLLLHELGHVLGLAHSPRAEDLMNAREIRTSTFTADERALLAMMYRHRRPGNAFPDRE